MITDRQPTARDIINELDNPTGEIAYVTWASPHNPLYGKRVEPWELFIDAASGWLRCNGKYMSLDMGRDPLQFGRWQAWRIRRAVRRWQERERISRIINATDPVEAWKAYAEGMDQ